MRDGSDVMAFLPPFQELGNVNKGSPPKCTNTVEFPCQECGLVKNPIKAELRYNSRHFKEYCYCSFSMPKNIRLPTISSNPLVGRGSSACREPQKWQQVAFEREFSELEKISYQYLVKCSKLKQTRLMLRHHGLNTRWGLILGEFLTDNKHITAVDLSHNCLRGGVDQLCHHFMNNESVKHLDLSNNFINEAGVVAVSNVLYVNKTLLELSLANNGLNDLEAESVFNALRLNTTLTTLYIQGNCLTKEIRESLEELLHETTTLTGLDLSRNNFDENFILAFFKTLKHNQTLETLCLAANNVTDVALQGASSMSTLCAKRLKKIDLSDNRLTDDCIPALLSILESNSNINELYIGRNKITSDGITNLLASLHTIGKTQLKHLNVEGTVLTAVTRGEYWRLKKRKYNDLVMTGIEGAMPVEGITALQMLELYAERNNLR